MTKNEQLNESSLTRVWQHVVGAATFGMISAYTQAHTLEENHERHKNLMQDVREMGYGFIPMKGGYKYIDGNGHEETSEEESLFVPNITAADIAKLGKKYGQETVLVKSDKGKTIDMIRPESGKIERQFKKFVDLDKEDTKSAWSTLVKSKRKKDLAPFTFHE